MNLLQLKWNNEELPGLDCLCFEDGKVIVFNYYSSLNNNIRQRRIRPFCETTIESLYSNDNDIFTSIEVYHKYKKNYKNDYLVCGAGSMGNEGFVALVSDSNNLIWAFFFGFSNPIIEIDVTDDILKCFSDNKIIITINLHEMNIIDIIEEPF